MSCLTVVIEGGNLSGHGYWEDWWNAWASWGIRFLAASLRDRHSKRRWRRVSGAGHCEHRADISG